MKDRLEGLSGKSQHYYVSGFSAMINNFKDMNISALASQNTIEFIRSSLDNKIASTLHSSIADTNNIINSLSYENSIVCSLMLEQGFRILEAIEIIQHSEKYLKDNMSLTGVVGKGGQEYNLKEISSDLYYKIINTEAPSYYELIQKLKEYEVTTHDFRYSFAQNKFESLISSGVNFEEALKVVSEELNHYREDTTLLYLRLK